MFDALAFDRLVSGRRQGLVAGALRTCLRWASLPYGAAVRIRNRHFDRKENVNSVEVPVISVGNLTMGGTGKSPCIAWLANWLLKQGFRPAIVSRGYRSVDGRPNDEAQELANQLPTVPHVQHTDRLQAARRAIDEFQCDVILLDDGFQHRRLFRDLDVVLLDATQPFGYDKLFPAGMLREPVTSLRRADAVILTRSDAIPERDHQRIQDTVRQHAPHAVWATACHAPVRLENRNKDRLSIESIAGWQVAAFCGIGNPAAFSATLSKSVAKVVDFRAFPDHHHFRADELEHWTRTLPQVDGLVCTGKDLVKLASPQVGGIPLWALMIEMQLQDSTSLEALLAAKLECRPTNRTL